MIATAVEGASDLEAVLQLALSTARRMQESIEGLLRYASVDEPQTSAVAADDVLDRALADLASELEAVGAEIVREPLPTVEADAAQLRGVFHNLVMNAVRYRSADPLRVEIGFVDGAVYVRDNGKGIDPAEQQRVFELFRRATSAGEAGGTGIGLALARRVIEAHGGRLWLESEPGRGTVFFFRLHVTA